MIIACKKAVEMAYLVAMADCISYLFFCKFSFKSGLTVG